MIVTEKILTKNGKTYKIIILQAEEDMYLVNITVKNAISYCKIAYLSPKDCKENYIEMTQEQLDKMIADFNEKQKNKPTDEIADNINS